MSEKRYGKPNMNNLPYELGKAIFEEMDNSIPVDQEKMEKEVRCLEERMLEGRNKELYGK